MTNPGAPQRETTDIARQIADLMLDTGSTAAVAESLTSGAIATQLGAAHDSSQWFCGGVVAYLPRIKFDVLGVTPGPVITEECARQMASGIARLMSADFAVAVTGAGGPGSEEGKRAGTTFIATSSEKGVRVQEHHFDGDPEEVVHETVRSALLQLVADIEDALDRAL